MSDVPNERFPNSTPDNERLLIAAARGRDEATVRALTQEGTNPNVVDAENGWTPLFWAVGNREAETARLLLRHGADANLRNARGQTPLAEALHGNVSDAIIAVLLGYGADPNMQDRFGQTPVDTAVTMGYDSVLEMLGKAGGKLELQRNPGKYLFSALDMLNAASLKGLIALGADIEGLQAPLIYAISHSRGQEKPLLEVLEVLLDAGLDVNEHTGYHTTPLMWAVAFELAAVTNYLLERGADVRLEDDLGRTALWWAVQFGYQDIQRVLKEALEAEYDELVRRIDRFDTALSRLSGKKLVVLEAVSPGRTEIHPSQFLADKGELKRWADAHGKRSPKDSGPFLIVQCLYDSANASDSPPDPFARSSIKLLAKVGDVLLLTQTPRRIFNTRSWQEVRNDMASLAITDRFAESDWIRARETAFRSAGRAFVVKLVRVFTLVGGKQVDYQGVLPLPEGLMPEGRK